MFLIIILVLVFIFAVTSENNKLKDENANLKRQLMNVQNNQPHISFCPKCGNDLRNSVVIPNDVAMAMQQQQVPLQPQQPVQQYMQPLPNQPQINYQQPNVNVNMNQPQPKVKVNTLTKEEQKNNLILITGAILIVLSAIIFLMTTWEATSNAIKTIIILLMLVIFFITSRISDTKFHLKQTSKVFFYISLCYIPISLLSISLFGLFGQYLSIYGEGKYIYFSLCCALVSIIYYYTNQKEQNTFLRILTELFMLITIFFISLIFNADIYIESIIILLYTITRELISIKLNKRDTFDNVLYICLSLLVAFHTLILYFISIVATHIPIGLTIYNLLILFDIYIASNKLLKQPKVFEYIYPIFSIITCALFANTTGLSLSFTTKQIIVISSFYLLTVLNIFKDKFVKPETFLSITISSIIVLLSTKSSGLLPSIIITSYLLLAIIYYFTYKDDRKLMGYIINITIIALSIGLSIDFDINKEFLILVPSIMSIIPLLTNKEHDYITSCQNIGIIASCFEIFALLFTNDTYVYISLIIVNSIILFCYFIKNKLEFAKYFSYILFNVAVIKLLCVLDLKDSIKYGLTACTLLTIFIESLFKKAKTANSYIYIIIATIITIGLLNIDVITSFDIITFISIIIIDVSLLFFDNINKKDPSIAYIIAASLIPGIYFSDALLINDINFMMILSVIIITLTTYVSCTKKKVQYTVISYIYIASFLLFYDINFYIKDLILLGASTAQLLCSKDNIKDLYKFIVYTCILALFQKFIFDFDLNEVTFIFMGSIYIYAIIIIRTIIKKYFNDYKFLEYFISFITNFIALSRYVDEFDGMLYVSLLLILVFVSYSLKVGPIFLVSLIFIILNVFVLTREFWLNIPWWIYVLCAGIILVLFAVRNEANNNKTKEKLNDIKQKLNL